MDDIQTFIISYISDNAASDTIIDASTNFVDSGLLDSFAILNLIMTLESQYGVKFEPRELADPELRIVATLTHLTKQKMA
jgi:acyl carrier protein